MKKSKQKTHLPIIIKKEICKLRDDGMKIKQISEIYDIPEKTIRSLKPDRKNSYDGIKNYFINYITHYHVDFIIMMRLKEAIIQKILIQLIKDPDDDLKNLISVYQKSRKKNDILSKKRVQKIIGALKKFQHKDNNIKIQKQLGQQSHLSNILVKEQGQIQQGLYSIDNQQEQYSGQQQIELTDFGQNGIDQLQYQSDIQEYGNLFGEPEIYHQNNSQSQPQFGYETKKLTKLDYINPNDIASGSNDICDQQYHLDQYNKVELSRGFEEIWSLNE